MRSPVSWLTGGASTPANRESGSRPEAARRQTLAVNSRLVLAFSAAGLPAALWMLVAGGTVLPFVLSVLGLAVGFVTLALHHRGQAELVAAGHVYGTLLAGLLLSLVDPAVADVGLAVAILAPVQAALLMRAPVARGVWLALALVAGLAAASSLSHFGWPESWRGEFNLVAGVALLVAALMVANAAHRMSAVSGSQERGQVNAYRHLVESVQDAVIRFGADGGLAFASRSSEPLFGCRRYELTGSGLLDRMHILDRPAYMTAFAIANQDGKARTVEVRMRRDNAAAPATAAQFVWIEIALSPVIDGEPAAGRHEVVALLRDVTARRDDEDAARRARKAAEEASLAKSRFLATIGHELRTPLNAIVGFSEMMASGIAGELAPAQREYAHLIHRSGRHLTDVVQMLLDMSRLEAGKLELQIGSFQPDALLEPCLQIVDGMARQKSIRLATDVPRLLPALVADERACRQVLINLVANAVKFSGENSLVTVSMRRQGRHINISVADQGIGMDEEAVRRIGEAFFQAGHGTRRPSEGTGLGLSIVKGLVELHDGTLHAVSTPGQGTTMTVLLPINGPATKVEETGAVTQLHRESAAQNMAEWQDERKRAQ